jgi:hypothetical protein
MEDYMFKKDEEVVVEAAVEVVEAPVVEESTSFVAPSWSEVAEKFGLDPDTDVPALRAAVVEFQYSIGRGGMNALGDLDEDTVNALFAE